MNDYKLAIAIRSEDATYIMNITVTSLTALDAINSGYQYVLQSLSDSAITGIAIVITP